MKTSTRDVDIVMVNWNSGSCLRNALNSLYLFQPADCNFHVIVVDNASSDNSELCVAEFEARLIKNSCNIGFSRAVNQALEFCDSPWVALINPDIVFTCQSITPLIKILEQDPKHAAAAPLLLNDKGELIDHHCDFFSPFTSMFEHPVLRPCKKAVIGFLAGFSNSSCCICPEIHKDGTDGAHWYEVPVIFAAFLVIKREVIDKISDYRKNREGLDLMSQKDTLIRSDKPVCLFDGRFFLYFEDHDLCRLINVMGYKMLICPGTQAMHSGGRCSRNLNTADQHMLRSRFLYVAKWHGRIAYLFEWFKTAFRLIVLCHMADTHFDSVRKRRSKQLLRWLFRCGNIR